MRPADQREAAAQLNTLNLFTLAGDVSDKKRDGGDVCVCVCLCGGGGGVL